MQKKAEELERQIAELPVGYLSKKNIHGKDRFYHQWTEDGKVRSKYLREGEKEPLEEQVLKRRSLPAQLKELKAVIHIILVKCKDICYNRLNVLKNKAEKNMRKELTQNERKYCCFFFTKSL